MLKPSLFRACQHQRGRTSQGASESGNLTLGSAGLIEVIQFVQFKKISTADAFKIFVLALLLHTFSTPRRVTNSGNGLDEFAASGEGCFGQEKHGFKAGTGLAHYRLSPESDG